jgi:hypothetical protein
MINRVKIQGDYGESVEDHIDLRLKKGMVCRLVPDGTGFYTAFLQTSKGEWKFPNKYFHLRFRIINTKDVLKLPLTEAVQKLSI